MLYYNCQEENKRSSPSRRFKDTDKLKIKKTYSKKFTKPLDNSTKKCYTIIVPRESQDNRYRGLRTTGTCNF